MWILHFVSVVALSGVGCSRAIANAPLTSETETVTAAIDAASGFFPLDSLVRLSRRESDVRLSFAIRQLPVAATVNPLRFPIQLRLRRLPTGIASVRGLALIQRDSVAVSGDHFSLHIAYAGVLDADTPELRVLFFLASGDYATYMTAVRLERVGTMWRALESRTLAQ